jgi:SAM-dependent methyltransferase
MSEFWNKRYSDEKYLYGKEPNQFLKEELSKIAPGKILFLGEGEGRNAAYAASIGWDVDAVDYSAAGKAKAERLASEKGARINYHVEDLTNYFPQQNNYDAVVLIYLHMEEDLREIILEQSSAALKSGGKIIMEVFEKEQIKNDSGGPRNIEMLYSLQDVVESFIDLDFEKLSKDNIELSEGLGHQGKASVIRFVGIKK